MSNQIGIARNAVNINKKLQLDHRYIRSCYHFSPHLAAELAEHHGLGMLEFGTWIPKRKLIMNAEMMTLPRPLVKEVVGCITHVRKFKRFRYSLFVYILIFAMYRLRPRVASGSVRKRSMRR